MSLAIDVLFKMLMSGLVLFGMLKLVMAPRSVEPWDARALYRLRCGGYGVPFEYGMMTFLKRPTSKGISELITCRSSTDTRLRASPGSSLVRADYRRTEGQFEAVVRKNEASESPTANRESLGNGLASPKNARGAE